MVLAHNRLKRHGSTICSELLGFKLLQAAKLSHHHEQFIKATIPKVSYDNITKKIKSIFSNKTEKSNTLELQTKAVLTYYMKEAKSDEKIMIKKVVKIQLTQNVIYLRHTIHESNIKNNVPANIKNTIKF